MDFGTLITLLHVLTGIFFAMNMIFMQRVVTGMMQTLPAGEAKRQLDNFLERKWRPIMTIVLSLFIVSTLGMLHLHHALIFSSPWYGTKVAIGLLATIAVSINHFYLRHKKRKLAHNPETKPQFEKVKNIGMVLEKTALIGAVTAGLLAIFLRFGLASLF